MRRDQQNSYHYLLIAFLTFSELLTPLTGHIEENSEARAHESDKLSWWVLKRIFLTGLFTFPSHSYNTICTEYVTVRLSRFNVPQCIVAGPAPLSHSPMSGPANGLERVWASCYARVDCRKYTEEMLKGHVHGG